MKKFSQQASIPGNEKWEKSIERLNPIDSKKSDIRSEFWRDYNRLLHSKAYSRLKHKTQVFHATANDNICTRIEHVNHVASVSYTICKELGLNYELGLAIAIGHDIGHAPFGHDGEKTLNLIAKNNYNGRFWHEKNSLDFADNIEILQNQEGQYHNLNLSYAVRDGLISHCGEVDENNIFPRNEAIDLKEIKHPNQYPPYTWEGAVVKIADKISYLGRDIEDALQLKILNNSQIEELNDILNEINVKTISNANNTSIIHSFIIDLCNVSTPENGIGFSEKHFKAINAIKKFNYKHIYLHPRLANYKKYSDLMLNTLFQTLESIDFENLKSSMDEKSKIFPKLISNFQKWLIKYSNFDVEQKSKNQYNNAIVYDISDKSQYQRAIVEFLSSTTDSFAIELYNELIQF